jgi:hypothetical protein
MKKIIPISLLLIILLTTMASAGLLQDLFRYMGLGAAVSNYNSNVVPSADDFHDSDVRYVISLTTEPYNPSDQICVVLTGRTTFRLESCPPGCESLCAERAPEGCTGQDPYVDSDGCQIYQWKDDYGKTCFDCGGIQLNPGLCPAARSQYCKDRQTSYKEEYNGLNEYCHFSMSADMSDWHRCTDTYATNSKRQSFNTPYFVGDSICVDSIDAAGTDIQFHMHQGLTSACDFAGDPPDLNGLPDEEQPPKEDSCGNIIECIIAFIKQIISDLLGGAIK